MHLETLIPESDAFSTHIADAEFDDSISIDESRAVFIGDFSRENFLGEIFLR
jgi:hypothetical protein